MLLYTFDFRLGYAYEKIYFTTIKHERILNIGAKLSLNQRDTLQIILLRILSYFYTISVKRFAIANL